MSCRSKHPRFKSPQKNSFGLLDTQLWWVGLDIHGLLFKGEFQGPTFLRSHIITKKKKKKARADPLRMRVKNELL